MPIAKLFSRTQSPKEHAFTSMLFIFLGLLCCVLSFQFFIVYCRALLAESAQVELSPNTISYFCVKEDEASGDDFARIVALVRMCQNTEEARSLRFVQIYYRLLTPILRLSVVSGPRLAKRVQHERRACTHFAAVILEKRIARARQFLKDAYPPQ